MINFILVIDESGEKQKSNKMASKHNAIGVMSGFILEKKSITFLRTKASAIYSFYKKKNQKLHITDLTKEEQHNLREDVISLFKTYNIKWFYEAYYSQGFYKNNNLHNRLGYNTHQGRIQSFHTYLFIGVFNKSIDLLAQTNLNCFHLDIVTDNIDKGIVKDFLKTAKKSLLTWDSIFQSFKLPINSKQISFEISCENTEITLLADVLSNMTLYYIEEKLKNTDLLYLNNKLALGEHPLRDLAIQSNEIQIKDYWNRI